MQTSMKRGILSDPFQCKPELTFFKVFFLFHMIYLRVHYERVYILLNKSLARILIRCPTLNEHEPFYLM